MTQKVNMRLLIVTQAIDAEDPVLGFFCCWVEEFAQHCERIEVICLKEGKHALPGNVRVHSLGKPSFAKATEGAGTRFLNRIRYTWRFLSLAWRLRGDYDAVFVHMNPEYVVLGGLFWRFAGKHIGLWYTHKSVDMKLRLATQLADIIFTASKESFRLASNKVRVMGHGINTEFFTPNPVIVRGNWFLSVGRLMPSKRHDLAIHAAVQAGVPLRIAGDGPERAALATLARELRAGVQFLGPLTQVQLHDEYQRAALLIHTSETGSLDKVVLEALACGLPVVTTSAAYPDLPVAHAEATPGALAHVVSSGAVPVPDPIRIQEKHSLKVLIPAILDAIQAI